MTVGSMYRSIGVMDEAAATACGQPTPGERADDVPADAEPRAVESSVVEPTSPIGLAGLEPRLRTCYPTATVAMVQQCIGDAIRSFSAVRVRQYLPILIERAAADALADATGSRRGLAPTSITGDGCDSR